jgi:hypothetical protein
MNNSFAIRKSSSSGSDWMPTPLAETIGFKSSIETGADCSLSCLPNPKPGNPEKPEYCVVDCSMGRVPNAEPEDPEKVEPGVPDCAMGCVSNAGASNNEEPGVVVSMPAIASGSVEDCGVAGGEKAE